MSDRYMATSGVGVLMTDPVGVGDRVMVGVKVMVGV